MSLKAIWSENTPYSKFLLTVGVVLIFAVFFTMAGVVGGALFYGVPMGQLSAMLADPANPIAISILKIGQVAYTLGGFALPALVLAWLFDPQPARFLSLKRNASGTSHLLAVGAVLAGLPLVNFLGELNAHLSLPSFLSGLENWMKEMEDQATKMLETLLSQEGSGNLLANVIILGILPAVSEELLFRGVVQRLFAGLFKNIHTQVWVTAILFSAIHMQFYGFLPRMVLGALMGYLLVWSGSLWLPVTAHFVNNTSVLLLTWFYREEMIGVNADTVGTQQQLTWLPVSILLAGFFLWMIWRREKRQDPEPNFS